MKVTVGNTDDFLFEVYVVDFGDNYHRTDDEPSSELERAARKIRRRYKNIHDYIDALAVYREYMAYMMLRHGGPDLFKIKLREDLIPDFIPPKPRMKNTPFNKTILKKGIVLSRVDTKHLNEDLLEQTVQLLSQDVEDDGLIIDTETKVKPVDKMLKRGEITPKVEMKKIRHISSIDYLEEYFRNKNFVAAKKKEKEKDEGLIPLTDIVSGKALEDLNDTTEQDDIIFYRGNYMNREAVDELQLYQKLGELGWNAVKIMKDHKVSGRITKIVKNQKKENKKKKKKMMKGNDFMVHVMEDAGYDSFGDFERDMLNMTSDNVFGR